MGPLLERSRKFRLAAGVLMASAALAACSPTVRFTFQMADVEARAKLEEVIREVNEQDARIEKLEDQNGTSQAN